MKKNLMLKVFSCITILVLSISVLGISVNADELSDIDEKIDQTKDKIDDVETEKSSMMNEVAKLNSQIAEYENEIEDLEDEIDELNENIKTKEKEIAEKEEIYEENYEKFKNRMVASYETGTVTYLDVILSSKHITDILSNWYYLSEIADADAEFLDSVEQQKLELEDAKKSLESDKEKIEANKENIEKTNKALISSKKVKDDYISQLSSEEKELQKELEQFEKDKKAIQEELRKLAEQNNTQITVTPNSAGYISPLKGRTTAKHIYCGYNGYPGHTGIDYSYSGINGENVYAVKDGTVAISTALRYDNGNYRSYGEYVVIDHHDGTMTLYAHGQSGSRCVTKGDTVKQGQKIMQVGSTGNSTGPHLHFEVRINGRCVDPTPYLP